METAARHVGFAACNIRVNQLNRAAVVLLGKSAAIVCDTVGNRAVGQRVDLCVSNIDRTAVARGCSDLVIGERAVADWHIGARHKPHGTASIDSRAVVCAAVVNGDVGSVKDYRTAVCTAIAVAEV